MLQVLGDEGLLIEPGSPHLMPMATEHHNCSLLRYSQAPCPLRRGWAPEKVSPLMSELS